jgi:hypothetical protein
MTIGVGVEGPSDRAFWDKVLHKHFRPLKFDIRNMNNRSKLIRETPHLLETFRDAHYEAGFVLVDRDQTPCVTKVLQEFDKTIQQEARQPLNRRFLFICIAIRELEAWFLADASAITAILPRAKYNAPTETGQLNAEKTLLELWRQQYGKIAFNKIDFAKRIAPKFNPTEDSQHSTSFSYVWNKIVLQCQEQPNR